VSFTALRAEILVILGPSGCGKSTLLKHLIGLHRPMSGDVLLHGASLVHADRLQRRALMRSFGVLYQSGALLGAMTVGENVALPLEEHTDLNRDEVAARVREKLTLVNLENSAGVYPAELSGGMRKRAGLARAMALDPDLLFFDEPSAGLDPISSAELDELMLRLRDEKGTTMLVVSHELDSIFTIADRVLILDKAAGGLVAEGDPRDLAADSQVPWIRRFLNRDGTGRTRDTRTHETTVHGQA
jgi:phospholipid/cholesterol/gamma-HCH transport system ATP-binding protein